MTDGTLVRRTIPPRIRPIQRATDLGAVRALKHGSLFLLADAFGDVRPDSRGLGLYDGDTRALSCASLRVDGQRPVVLRSGDGGGWHAVVELTNGDLREAPTTRARGTVIERESMGITRERQIAGASLRETITIANFTLHEHRVSAELELDADFADIFEVRGLHRDARGELFPIEVAPDRVVFGYRGLGDVRVITTVTLDPPPDTIDEAGPEGEGAVVLAWDLGIDGGAQRTITWTSTVAHEGDVVPVARHSARSDAIVARALRVQGSHPSVDPAAEHARWWSGGAAIASDNELVELTLQRGIEDLRVLVNDGPGEGQWYVAAGVPWFSTLFGRDAIVTALQTLPFHPGIAKATLDVLASLQATEDDPWRDAEPGKMPHELRTGELARGGVLPFSPYYGSVDATPLWVVLLGETYDWTGDLELVRHHWPAALRALEWIDRSGDLDGDGFVEYRRRSPAGLRNQGWKDSGDSIRDREGRLAEGPIALGEVQGYVFDAKVRAGRLARALGDEALALRLAAEAAELRGRFEAAFWLPDLDRYAMALDGEKRPADALSSVGGHLLWSGIADPEHAATLDEQLLGPSLFNGWGVRTLGASEAGYNPLGYHIGTVWPHDSAIASAGLKRYGRHDGATRLAQSLLESAQHFDAYRLPELFCGFDRDATRVPVAYPTACSPQAWAAGAPFLLLATLLGLEPDAAHGELRIVHPTLPPWISRLTIQNLTVGEGSVDLLFHRWRGMTAAELLARRGTVDVSVRL